MADQHTGPVVLIVEDNLTNRLLVRAVLARAGYRVAEAQSAAEAQARLRAITPDRILMDRPVPGQNGLSLTGQLNADPATAGMTVVALTAPARQDDRARDRPLRGSCDEG